MRSQAVLRKDLLRALYRASGGDTTKHLSVSDVADKVREKQANLEPVVRQLAEQGYVKVPEQQLDPFLVFTVTARGIEEGERMQSFFRRAQEEYPFLYQCCWSVVTVLATALLLWLLGLKK